MGRLVLQMMISVDGMVAGPKGELDWIAGDGPLFQDHIERATQAKAIVIASGLYQEGMPDYWAKAAKDESAPENIRATGKAVTDTPMVVYSHEEIPVKSKDSLRVTKNDQEFAEDVKRLKQETDGVLICWGGVRLARSLIQNGLLDEIHLDVCPIILGEGKPLFADIDHRTNLHVLESVSYESGATMVRYEVVKA